MLVGSIWLFLFDYDWLVGSFEWPRKNARNAENFLQGGHGVHEGFKKQSPCSPCEKKFLRALASWWPERLTLKVLASCLLVLFIWFLLVGVLVGWVMG
jgi:hypothetical protein